MEAQKTLDKMKYDLITLYAAEDDLRRDGRDAIVKIVVKNERNEALSAEDRMYVEACKYVLTQKTDHNGSPF